MREDYLIAMANLVNGSLLGYEDRSRVPEYEKTVDDYVDSLEDKNQKYKEVIDKAIEYIKSYKIDYSPYELSDYNVRQILEILKGDK